MLKKVFNTHFEEPIAIGIGMRLKRNRSLMVLGHRDLRPGRRRRGGRRCGRRGRDDAGPSVRALFLRRVLQVGGCSSFRHDTPFEHPTGRHKILLRNVTTRRRCLSLHRCRRRKGHRRYMRIDIFIYKLQYEKI